MVEESTIPLLNAQQMGMANLAHSAILMPEIALATTRELALNLLRQESRQVHKTEESKNSALVDEEKDGGGASGNLPRRRKSEKNDDAPEDIASSPEKPLVGNLLNVKV